MKVSKVEISSPIRGVCKQSGIWGHDMDKNGISPLVYLQRPKWIKDDAIWQKIIDGVDITLPIGFEVK